MPGLPPDGQSRQSLEAESRVTISLRRSQQTPSSTLPDGDVSPYTLENRGVRGDRGSRILPGRTDSGSSVKTHLGLRHTFQTPNVSVLITNSHSGCLGLGQEETRQDSLPPVSVPGMTSPLRQELSGHPQRRVGQRRVPGEVKGKIWVPKRVRGTLLTVSSVRQETKVDERVS